MSRQRYPEEFKIEAVKQVTEKFLGHLLDRFDLEFFGVTLTTHGTSYLGLIMRLGGVYETRGDSLSQKEVFRLSYASLVR
ncbi:hypothetical protein [Pseudomonas sp. HTZ2]|uniref:hypothetical protein n=1 Tax=Pseudomonas sp. HTZ2 TaxID=3075220 RepID=UPI00295882A5|nr:hypothetical protein [Pseudomonas sp. HTZ2]